MQPQLQLKLWPLLLTPLRKSPSPVLRQILLRPQALPVRPLVEYPLREQMLKGVQRWTCLLPVRMPLFRARLPRARPVRVPLSRLQPHQVYKVRVLQHSKPGR